MLYLKADTVTEVTIGPAVAVGDGFTPVTTLSIASADEAHLMKHNNTTAVALAGTLAVFATPVSSVGPANGTRLPHACGTKSPLQRKFTRDLKMEGCGWAWGSGQGSTQGAT